LEQAAAVTAMYRRGRTVDGDLEEATAGVKMKAAAKGEVAVVDTHKAL